MLANFKLSIATIALAGLIVTSTITAPFTRMFGKNYFSNKDYACCKNNQLVLNHYYTINVFWLEVSNGYTEENTGKISKECCDIRCNNQ